jgi:outer membrane immunogenic protein
MSSRALLVALALCAGVSAGQAADQSVARSANSSSYYPNSYYPGFVNWSGFYVGLNFGGGLGRDSYTNPFNGLAVDPHPTFLGGGVQVGTNWQMDAFVLGWETDFDFLDMNNSVTDAAGQTERIESHWLATVTGRAGYAIDRTLLFVKGGAAFGDEQNKIFAPTGANSGTGRVTQTGWTVGGGVEYGLSRSWSVRLEYDYIDFPADNRNAAGSLGRGNVHADFSLNRFSGAVNYRF